jgi:hypothetical protein
MARNTAEKVLSADLDSELVDKFCEQVDIRGFKKKRAIQGAIELWLSLPSALQAYILGGECQKDMLAGLLEYIIKNQIDVLRERFGDLMVKPSGDAKETGTDRQ